MFDHLRVAPDSPLAEALSTPLMVALARAIYSDTDADPTELIGITSVTELEDRLLAGFVPAVYTSTQHGLFAAEDARRWLGFLATHLRRQDTHDLAWWRLVRAVPRFVVGLVSGFMIALMLWLGSGLLDLVGTWTGDARGAWLMAASIGAVGFGIAGGILVAGGTGLYPSPIRLRLRVSVRLDEFWGVLSLVLRDWRIATWISAWLGGGGVFGLAAVLLAGSRDGVVFGIAAGGLAGAGILAVMVVTLGFSALLDTTQTVSPAQLLRTARGASLGQGLLVGVGASVVLWLTIWISFEPIFDLPFELVFAHGVWLLGGVAAVAGGGLVWMLCLTVWGPWLIARLWLSLTGRLPWSVMTFLDDAHRRGVLRQAGGVYQFRHARLQDYLATR